MESFSAEIKLLTAVCFWTLVSWATGAPVTEQTTEVPTVERWHMPCGGSVRVSPDFTIEIPNSNHSQGHRIRDIFQLWEKVKVDVLPRVMELKEKFLEKRFTDEIVIKALNTFEERIPSYADEILDGNERTRGVDIDQVDQVTEWARTSIRKFSWVAAYLGLAKEEESLHEKEYFRTHFAEAEESVYWVLCKLHQILANMHANPENTLSKNEAIPQNMSLMNDTILRHQRDYLALRDYNRFLDQFIAEITSLTDSYR